MAKSAPRRCQSHTRRRCARRVAANQGCLYELQTLAATPELRRVVVLINDRTELAPARAAAAGAPAGRFVWLAQRGDTPPDTEEALGALLGAPSEALPAKT